MLTHIYGVPTAIDALLFMFGAVFAFALVGTAAFGGVSARFAHSPRWAALWGSFHFLSVGGAIGTATLVAHLLPEPAGWLCAPLSSTIVYLLVVGAQFSAADKHEPRS